MPVQEQERLQVLKMIDAGTITVDEAFRLLDVLDRSAGPEDTVAARLATKALAGKVVRLKVSNLHSGRVKAQAQLPVQLLELGLRIGSSMHPESRPLTWTNWSPGWQTALVARSLRSPTTKTAFAWKS